MNLTEAQMRSYMERCIELAKTSYNKIGLPFVGSLVLSSRGEVVGEGYRKWLGSTRYLLHAERAALDEADIEARGGTLVTTLEPCMRCEHQKRQAFKPCAELIAERRITRVVFGRRERSGPSGMKYLQGRGIEVIQYDALNPKIEYELMTGLRHKQRA